MHAKIFAVYAAMLFTVLTGVLTRPIKATFQPPPPCKLSFVPDPNLTYSAFLDTIEFSVDVNCSNNNGEDQCFATCCASVWSIWNPNTHTWHPITDTACGNGPNLVCGGSNTYDMGIGSVREDYGPGTFQLYVVIWQGTCANVNYAMWSTTKTVTVP